MKEKLDNGLLGWTLNPPDGYGPPDPDDEEEDEDEFQDSRVDWDLIIKK